MDVHIVILLSGQPERHRALDWSQLGWLVEIDGEQMLVPDRDVLDIEVETLCFAIDAAELSAANQLTGGA